MTCSSRRVRTRPLLVAVDDGDLSRAPVEVDQQACAKQLVQPDRDLAEVAGPGRADVSNKGNHSDGLSRFHYIYSGDNPVNFVDPSGHKPGGSYRTPSRGHPSDQGRSRKPLLYETIALTAVVRRDTA